MAGLAVTTYWDETRSAIVLVKRKHTFEFDKRYVTDQMRKQGVKGSVEAVCMPLKMPLKKGLVDETQMETGVVVFKDPRTCKEFINAFPHNAMQLNQDNLSSCDTGSKIENEAWRHEASQDRPRDYLAARSLALVIPPGASLDQERVREKLAQLLSTRPGAPHIESVLYPVQPQDLGISTLTDACALVTVSNQADIGQMKQIFTDDMRTFMPVPEQSVTTSLITIPRTTLQKLASSLNRTEDEVINGMQQECCVAIEPSHHGPGVVARGHWIRIKALCEKITIQLQKSSQASPGPTSRAEVDAEKTQASKETAAPTKRVRTLALDEDSTDIRRAEIRGEAKSTRIRSTQISSAKSTEEEEELDQLANWGQDELQAQEQILHSAADSDSPRSSRASSITLDELSNWGQKGLQAQDLEQMFPSAADSDSPRSQPRSGTAIVRAETRSEENSTGFYILSFWQETRSALVLVKRDRHHKFDETYVSGLLQRHGITGTVEAVCVPMQIPLREGLVDHTRFETGIVVFKEQRTCQEYIEKFPDDAKELGWVRGSGRERGRRASGGGTSSGADASAASHGACSLCTHAPQQPQPLPCGHTFCRGCIMPELLRAGPVCPRCGDVFGRRTDSQGDSKPRARAPASGPAMSTVPQRPAEHHFTQAIQVMQMLGQSIRGGQQLPPRSPVAGWRPKFSGPIIQHDPRYGGILYRTRAADSQGLPPPSTAPGSRASSITTPAAGASAAGAGEDCVICLDTITRPKTLGCSHTFCSDCIDQAFAKTKPACPVCGKIYGSLKGDQPLDGRMNTRTEWASTLPGYPYCGVIVIDYHFPDGTQTSEHPQPGRRYKGLRRTAYLPDNDQGRKVARLLKKAFDARLTFTIGRSVTTGRENQVTWNGIHHKTSMTGGASNNGYPDPGYLQRVQDELAAKGITE